MERTSTAGSVKRKSRFSALFGGVQAAIVVGLVILAAWRYQVLALHEAEPVRRNQPLALAPVRDDPSVVSDAELERLHSRLRPSARVRLSVTGLEHALRLWGAHARAADSEQLTGADLLAILLDYEAFRRAFGDAVEPLIVEDETGTGVRVEGSPTASGHYDHLLAVLAEVGVPLARSVRTREGRATVGSLLEYSLRHSSLWQAEYEWTALAYLHYLEPTSRWVSSEGQEMTFDRLARRMLRPELSEGVCAGAHRLQSLTAYLRADSDLRAAVGDGFLTAETRAVIAAFLRDATARLTASQSAEGAWGPDWWRGRPPTAPPGLSEGLLVTGHVLEWWAGAPDEFLPPAATVDRAAQWMLSTATAMTDAEVFANYSFLTHVASGLSLWRGRVTAGANPDGVP